MELKYRWRKHIVIFVSIFLVCIFLISIPAGAACQSGYHACNGRCVACPSGSVLGSDCKCHAACGDSSHYCTGGSCCGGHCISCPSGSVLGSDCNCHTACGDSSHYCTSGSCCGGHCISCPSGSVLGSDCNCHTACGSSTTYCSSGSCCNGNCVSCSDGEILGDDCLCHTPCGTSSSYCREGSTCLNGECLSCREGYYLGKDGSCHSTQNVAVRKSAASTNSNEVITRSYNWNFKGTSYSWKLTIPQSLYTYYRMQPHDSSELTTYKQYVISSQDKQYLDALLKKLKESGEKKGYSDAENVMNVISFVQSLPYFYDNSSTIYDNYPRYPIETLVDNGGDCEDTAILTAAFLKEMGYGVVLVNPSGHMAVGVKCNNCAGTYYEYDGDRYYYLETTGNNFQIGEIPSDEAGKKVRIIPLT